MSKTLYTKDHEYIVVAGGIGAVGVTDFAQSQLGDVVFVELPQLGATPKKGDQAAVVESVKAASEVYSPVSGEVVEVNGELEDNPALVNEEPAGKGWFFKIKLANEGELADLLDEAAYTALIASLV
jgi:glycine cleavage system H protein